MVRRHLTDVHQTEIALRLGLSDLDPDVRGFDSVVRKKRDGMGRNHLPPGLDRRFRCLSTASDQKRDQQHQGGCIWFQDRKMVNLRTQK